jgi:hypothetical protein
MVMVMVMGMGMGMGMGIGLALENLAGSYRVGWGYRMRTRMLSVGVPRVLQEVGLREQLVVGMGSRGCRVDGICGCSIFDTVLLVLSIGEGEGEGQGRGYLVAYAEKDRVGLSPATEAHKAAYYWLNRRVGLPKME